MVHPRNQGFGTFLSWRALLFVLSYSPSSLPRQVLLLLHVTILDWGVIELQGALDVKAEKLKS